MKIFIQYGSTLVKEIFSQMFMAFVSTLRMPENNSRVRSIPQGELLTLAVSCNPAETRLMVNVK